jgi:hypothetical protein
MALFASLPILHKELIEHVRRRTAGRVRGLAVELRPEGIVLSGRAATFYVKQLAQQGIRDLLPHVELHNEIVVGEEVGG